MHMIRNLFKIATLGTTISSPKPARFNAIPVQSPRTQGSTNEIGPKWLNRNSVKTRRFWCGNRSTEGSTFK